MLTLFSRLARNAAVLEHSFDPVAAPAAASRVGPAYPTEMPLGALVRQRWNQVLGGAVAGVRDMEWGRVGRAALGGAQDVGRRIGSVANAMSDGVAADGPAAADATQKVADAAERAKDKAAAAVKDSASKKTEDEKMAARRRDTLVDAPARPSAKITDAPKRLV